MAPKVVDKTEKKRQILQAAIGVFAKTGLANAKMSQIAQAAGIGKGTIYEYFSSKEELFWKAFEVYMEEVEKGLEKRLWGVDDPVDQIRFYISAWGDMLNDAFRDFASIMIEIWAESLRKGQTKGQAMMQEMYAQYRVQIKAILDRGVALGRFKPMNSTIVAAMIIGALDGLFLQWLMEPALFPVGEAMDEFAAIVVDGLTEGD